MIGGALINYVIPGMFVGVVYLLIFLWWQTGHTPIDLAKAIADNLLQITDALKGD